MKVLIVGSGGREHAIGSKIKTQNPKTELFFAPGNGGTESIGTNLKKTSTKEEIIQFAESKKIDLVIIGPEAYLVQGIVDELNSKNIAVFGADKKASLLEGSKTYAKDFMQQYGVKTATFKNFKHYVDARDYLTQANYPLVIKASGLAAGKGVVICQEEFDAQQELRAIMLDKNFGDAGNEVVIEEYLEGYEVSILSFFNGKEIVPMLSAKDHKKIGENETGLNTGGMGVISPNPLYTKEDEENFKKDILQPTLKGLLTEKLSFAGVIFFGLMITKNGVYLLEYNLRFGDPETQTVLPLMKNNLLDSFMKAIKGESIVFEWEEKHAVCVVICSGGYPLQFEKGFDILGLDDLDKKDYYIAGAKSIDNQLQTSGGRVLNIMGIGSDKEEAISNAYHKIKKVRFDYNYYRKDIGKV